MKYTDLPHDETIERGIFNRILVTSPKEIKHIVDKLQPSDFFSEPHQQIWQAMIDLFSLDKDIDFPSMRMQLKKSDIDPQPALRVLSESLGEDISASHLNDLVQEVKNKSLLRQIIRASKSHTYSAQMENANAMKLLTDIEKDILSIVDKTEDPKPVDAEGIVNEVRRDMALGIREGWRIFNTGFSKIDAQTGGLIPSQMWVFGAYTGTGKTFWLLQVILNVLEQGAKVILFSTEMDRKMNMLRMIGNLAELGSIQMIKNELVDYQIEAMQKAQEKLASYKNALTIYDNVNTTAEIRLKIKKQQLTHGADIVVVDYIQGLKGDGEIYSRMADASSQLYTMTKELRITLLAGSQIPQDAAGYKNKEAINYKGAGEIAEVCDVGLWMKKTEGSTTDRTIGMRKLRHGEGKNAYARLSFPSGRFIDLDVNADDKHISIKDQLPQ